MRKLIPLLFVLAASAIAAPLVPAIAAPIAKHGMAVQSNVTDVRYRGHVGDNRFQLNRGNFHNRSHFRRHNFWRGPVFIRSYGNDCYWLKRKAINTGSRYWWSRYNACRWN